VKRPTIGGVIKAFDLSGLKQFEQVSGDEIARNLLKKKTTQHLTKIYTFGCIIKTTLAKVNQNMQENICSGRVNPRVVYGLLAFPSAQNSMDFRVMIASHFFNRSRFCL
jgi:hypothetical protein